MKRAWCLHADDFGFCSKQPKKFKIFKRDCIEMNGSLRSCSIADRPERPQFIPKPQLPNKQKSLLNYCPHCGKILKDY